VLFFRAVKEIEASEVSIIGASGVVVTIMASYIFLGERLSGEQFFGAFLVLVAIVVLEYRKGGIKLSKGALMALAGTGMYGLAVISDAYIVRNYNAVSYVPIMSFLPGLVLSFMYPAKLKIVLRSITRVSRNLVIFTGLYAVQAVAYYMALELGAGPGQLNTTFKFQVVLSVVLAMIFLGERKQGGRKLLSAAIGVLGVLLVT